jgi:hypothetical protein
MTDHITEQSAAAFWRQVDQRITKALDTRFKAQTGVVPDTAYGSIKTNAFGQVIWGSAGGSLPFLFHYTHTGGLTITSSTETRLDFNSMDQDDQGLVTTGASWKFTVASDGWYAPTLNLRWFPSGGALTAGDNWRLNLYRTNVLIDEIHRWTAETATPSGTILQAHLRIPWFYQSSWLINYRIDNQMSQSMVFSGDPMITMERIGDPSP